MAPSHSSPEFLNRSRSEDVVDMSVLLFSFNSALEKIFKNINVVRPPCFLRGVSTTNNFGCFYLSASESPSIKLQGQRAKGTLIISMEAKRLHLGQWAHFYFILSVPFSPELLRTETLNETVMPTVQLHCYYYNDYCQCSDVLF